MPYTPKNGDDLHNYNSYCYLRQLQTVLEKGSFVDERITQISLELNSYVNEKYDPSSHYGNLYTKLQADFDKFMPTDEELTDPKFASFLKKFYLNDNNALENTYETIKDVLDVTNQSSRKGAHAITDKLNRGRNQSRNRYRPQLMDSLGKKLYGVVGPTFSPQYATSLPSIRHYQYQTDDLPKEIRMGTQGQYRLWGAEVSHLFKTWLRLTAPKEPDENRITHIYFNNLGRDRSGVEGSRERKLTTALENLNKDSGLGVAVITLPADKGLFSSKNIFSEDKYADTSTFRDQVLSIMKAGKCDDVPIADLYIPSKIKKIIYSGEDGNYSEAEEDNVLHQLLDKSFEAFGYSTEQETLTNEKMQALYFHFVKYELTNHILEKTKPQSFNVSCKDGIDRAGSASLYYNLMKSIESEQPMTQQEFERNLHGPAAMVKGRGMNIHRERVWSVVNQYVNANKKNLAANEDIKWIIKWRDINIPAARSKSAFEEYARNIQDTISVNGENAERYTREFIGECIQLGKDDRCDKKFLMDMIYESKSVLDAVQETNSEKIESALDHLSQTIESYPAEIKKPAFLKKVHKFFQSIAAAAFKSHAHQGTKDNVSKESQITIRGKFQAYRRKMEGIRTKDMKVKSNDGELTSSSTTQKPGD